MAGADTTPNHRTVRDVTDTDHQSAVEAIPARPGRRVRHLQFRPVPRQIDVIEIEGMMETFAAIVVAAVVVPLVLLEILLVEALTGFILSFL
jgi:hypothetical protein